MWRGDSRSCEQGEIVRPSVTQPVNRNGNQSTPQPIKTTETSHQPITGLITNGNQPTSLKPIKTTETSSQPISGLTTMNGNQTTDQPIISDVIHPDTLTTNQCLSAIEDNRAATSPVKIQNENVTNEQLDNIQCNSNSNTPIRFGSTNNQPIKLSCSSSSDSSESSKTTTWGKVKSGSPKKSNKGKCDHDNDNKHSNTSPNTSPTKNKNEKVLTSWKNVSPSKSSSSSDLEQSSHSTGSNDCTTNRIFRFSSTKSLKDSNDSSFSSNTDNETQTVRNNTNMNIDKPAKGLCEGKCGSSCNRDSKCVCVKKCNVCCPNSQVVQCNSDVKQNNMESSQTSSNDNGSPKRERREGADDGCDNDYFYDEDFSVQFDTNLRETSITPIDSDPNTTILDFPDIVTGSYLRFHGGSSNVSFNNSKASSQNASVNTLKVSNVNAESDIVQELENGPYDSENSGNSGSRVSTMEIDSSDPNMLGSSDLIELSDGPLFTPTPSHSQMAGSSDSLDGKGQGHLHGDRVKGQGESQGQEGEMSGSGESSSEPNLNVNCSTRKEEYFLSFDGSHSKVSGSETDISLSYTSHDSYQGHNWMGNDGNSGSHDLHSNGCHGDGHDASNEFSGSEGQEETSDSFHMCFNKLSPRHRGGQYIARENLTGCKMKRLVTVKESSPEHGETSEEETTRTSTTLTAGSKTVSSLSPQMSPKKRYLRQCSEPVCKNKVKDHHQGQQENAEGQGQKKPEQLILVGIGKPVEILRKAAVHSHTLPKNTKLVSWKQVKNIRNGNNKSQSLPELPTTCTSWENVAAVKCRKIQDVSESFHNKRHSASLFEFYQRLKSESNPVSPETMTNLEQILWPQFVCQKLQNENLSDSSGSSHECPNCVSRLPQAGLPESGSQTYAHKRIFDWLKMAQSGSLKECRPNSLACQTGLVPELSTKETLISPQTVTLWCGTKNVSSQFPPKTKDCSIQTFVNLQNSIEHLKTGNFMNGVKIDKALQTSDFEEEEILSILSDNFEDFSFLISSDKLPKDLISCPDLKYYEKDLKNQSAKIHRSKSADCYKNPSILSNKSSKDYQKSTSRVGRSKSTGRLADRSLSCRRMGQSKHYSHQSLPDIAFLSSSISIEKEESKDSLFDAMKLELPYPVTIAPKTELEQFNIYKQSSNVCHRFHDNKQVQVQVAMNQYQGQVQGHTVPGHLHHAQKGKCCVNMAKFSLKGEPDNTSSSSGISTSSASSGIDPGYCDCRSVESPENDLERLIFYPPHTEEKIKIAKDTCNARRKAQSVPARLSDCANGADPKLMKYANEMRPLGAAKGQCQGHSQGSSAGSKGQCRINQKWVSGQKAGEGEVNEQQLYALEEEQTPVASPDTPTHRDSGCYDNSCHDISCNHDTSRCGLYGGGESDFTESDFYRAVENDQIIVIGHNGCYGGVAMEIDSTSSSGSSIPNGDRKPLKSCLRKRNRVLRSTRSMSATDTMTLNFEELEAKVKLYLLN